MHPATYIHETCWIGGLPATAVKKMLYSAPEVPPQLRAQLAMHLDRGPASFRGSELSCRAALMASAPRCKVEPQSPSPTLHSSSHALGPENSLVNQCLSTLHRAHSK